MEKEALRAQALRTSARLFLEQGYTATTVRGIADEAGVNVNAMIRALGSRLQALHIHDNDRWHDSHKLPFTMDIDFDAVIEALREIGYKGYISLEACEHLRGFAPEAVPAGVAEMAACARRLEKMFQNG